MRPKNENGRIAILTPNPFPNGNVATNRFKTYAKALANNDCFVKVFVLKATEVIDNQKNWDLRGQEEKVHFEVLSKNIIWDVKKNKLYKFYLYLYGIYRCLVSLRKDKIGSIILYTNDPFYMLLFGLYSKSFSIHFFIDKSEYPVVYYRKRSIGKYLYLKVFKIFDGILTMTKELENYYDTIINKKAKCFFLPMTVDCGRFEMIIRKNPPSPYMACLFGVHNRDCILDTIKAFILFKEKSKNDLQLHLLGDIENLKDREEILSYLNQDLASNPNIIFTGNVNGADIPELLINATCLVTTPIFYSSGGFPTKLGEYLATGNPVLANEIGEIKYFLTHKENSLLAQAGDIKQIAENMLFVTDNPQQANEIGIRGRELAKKVFNAETYVTDLIDFLNTPAK